MPAAVLYGRVAVGRGQHGARKGKGGGTMTARRSAGPDGLTFTERARRQQIIECTIDLISTRGYPSTSLSAIAEEA
ncbi:hypothetical protein GCM10020000_73230 [Streptomyces olivoverticillatus]